MISLLKKLLGSNKAERIADALQRDAVIIDVRTPGEFSSGHIKGSKNIPLSQIPAQAEKLKKAGKPVIVCCASGMRSAQAAGVLTNKGVEAINGGGWYSLQNKLS
ncbi:MAG: rhodanese-like domain-containing protein [Bacteroidota bacterium]